MIQSGSRGIRKLPVPGEHQHALRRLPGAAHHAVQKSRGGKLLLIRLGIVRPNSRKSPKKIASVYAVIRPESCGFPRKTPHLTLDTIPRFLDVILSAKHATHLRHETRAIRNPVAPRRGRHGRGVSREGHAVGPHRCNQSVARTSRRHSRSAPAIRARSSRRLRVESSAHLHALRCRLAGWNRISRHGVPRRRYARGAFEKRAAAVRAGAEDWY